MSELSSRLPAPKTKSLIMLAGLFLSLAGILLGLVAAFNTTSHTHLIISVAALVLAGITFGLWGKALMMHLDLLDDATP